MADIESGSNIVVLLSFQCYLHENLDLIIIFFTLLQFFYLKRYFLANIIIGKFLFLINLINFPHM